jgi:pyrroline-5-carboxylate reductase
MSDAHHPTIGFIGAGNMAHCLINGLIADDYPATQLWASDPSTEQLDFLNHQFHIHTTKENETVVSHADILVPLQFRKKNLSSFQLPQELLNPH